MNRPVTLEHTAAGEAGLLKVSVDIAGEHEGLVRKLRSDLLKDIESFVWPRVAIQVQTMTIKTPGHSGVTAEQLRRSDILKTDARRLEGGVGAPESLRASEIGKAGVDTHSCPRRHQKRVRVADELCGLDKRVFV